MCEISAERICGKHPKCLFTQPILLLSACSESFDSICALTACLTAEKSAYTGEMNREYANTSFKDSFSNLVNMLTIARRRSFQLSRRTKISASWSHHRNKQGKEGEICVLRPHGNFPSNEDLPARVTAVSQKRT